MMVSLRNWNSALMVQIIVTFLEELYISWVLTPMSVASTAEIDDSIYLYRNGQHGSEIKGFRGC